MNFLAEIQNWDGNVFNHAKRIVQLGATFGQVHWRYFVAVTLIVAIACVYRAYRGWHHAWLSGLINSKIREMSTKRRRDRIRSASGISLRNFYLGSRASLFRTIQSAEQYLWTARWQIRDFYFPTVTSFILIGTIILIFFLAPHYSALPHINFADLVDDLKEDEAAKKVFEGLVVIAVGLIIFVAELNSRYENSRKEKSSSTNKLFVASYASRHAIPTWIFARKTDGRSYCSPFIDGRVFHICLQQHTENSS